MSKKFGALTYPEPLGPTRPVVGDLYLFTISLHFSTVFVFCVMINYSIVGGSEELSDFIFRIE
jgi:hypothetical protein